jgi:hypothetical protein
MIKNKVYRLKAAAVVAEGITLNAGQEIEVVNDVVYVGGNMIPPTMQTLFIKWITNNLELFIDDTRTWK